MPFFSRLPRLAAVLTVCACLPPIVLANAVETAGSTLFEAAPLLIGAEIAERIIRRPRSLTWLTALAGCGCGPLPGALTVSGAFLCALAFGPACALVRGFAAFIAVRMRAQECRADQVASPCVLDRLGTVAQVTCVGALFLAFIRTYAFMPRLGEAPPALLFTAGLILGLLTPCTTGALAAAAALRASVPALACGMLWSAGLFPVTAFHTTSAGSQRIDGRLLYLLIACSCLLVALGGGAGLVHPKLTPLVAGGAVFALIAAGGPSMRAQGKALFAALLMFAALILRTPPPPYDPGETTLENLYPGRPLHFAGEIAGHGGATTLVRYAVVCCRADAAPLALRLDRVLPERDGAWIEAEGIVERSADGMRLRVRAYHAVAQPADPFLYI